MANGRIELLGTFNHRPHDAHFSHRGTDSSIGQSECRNIGRRTRTSSSLEAERMREFARLSSMTLLSQAFYFGNDDPRIPFVCETEHFAE